MHEIMETTNAFPYIVACNGERHGTTWSFTAFEDRESAKTKFLEHSDKCIMQIDDRVTMFFVNDLGQTINIGEAIQYYDKKIDGTAVLINWYK